MKKGGFKRRAALALSALTVLAVGAAALAGCGTGGKEGEKGVNFTNLSQVEAQDEYLANALEKEYDYLTLLDSDKLLYWFYKNASLVPTAQSGYGGNWESSLIGGHTMGHYLSALAQGAVNAGLSKAQRDALLAKIDYVVGELRTCQDNAEAAGASFGFLWGARTLGGKDPEIQFDNVEKGYANIETQAWVPWYTMHKIIAGLYDVVVYTGNETAREVLLNLCDWVYERVSGWSDATQRIVLGIEYGGMNDILYSVYALTGEEKYAVAAHCFDEESLFTLVDGETADYLNNRHANTTIPKILGALNRYVTCDGKTVDGEEVDAEFYLTVAEKFFDRVVEKHTYITGGNSEWGHFGKDGVLNGERTNCNCETCNTYNMLKLARTLFTITGEKRYLDYYENTYINAILSSQNPETGMTTYFQPMASGYFKVYSTPENSFWCCTGSGMESMTKLNDSIYYDAGDATYVALYFSSTYTGRNVTLRQTADLEHSDEVNFEVERGSARLYLRVPDWAAGYALEKNGAAVTAEEQDGFLAVDVKKGDSLKLTLTKQVVAYNLPDGKNTYAFRYGPYVLSAELGTQNMTTSTQGVSVTVPDVYRNCAIKVGEYQVSAADVASFMAGIDGKMQRGADGKFTLACENGTLTYSLHYKQHTQRYAIYLNFTAGEVTESAEPYVWRTADTRQPGYGQYETDLKDGENSVGATNDTAAGGTTRYALAGKSFTYSAVKVQKGEKNRLVVHFAKADNGKSVKITSGSQTLYENASLSYTGSETTYAVEIALPETLVSASNGTIPVTVEGMNGAASARICGFVYSQYFVNNALYFVDCGDYTPSAPSAGDYLGKYNSVTDRVYGADEVTGKQWGIVDEHATNIGGTAPHGIATNSTWAYEYADASAALTKTDTNRYTKNQYENGVARKLCYRFELEDGTYQVQLRFADPWGCSRNVNVSANGTRVIENAPCDREVYANVTVKGGFLTLEFTTEDKCINLCYITIVSL